MIDCLCGHGDDGRHSEEDTAIGRIISCPYATPGTIWGFDRRYLTFVVENVTP